MEEHVSLARFSEWYLCHHNVSCCPDDDWKGVCVHLFLNVCCECWWFLLRFAIVCNRRLPDRLIAVTAGYFFVLVYTESTISEATIIGVTYTDRKRGEWSWRSHCVLHGTHRSQEHSYPGIFFCVAFLFWIALYCFLMSHSYPNRRHESPVLHKNYLPPHLMLQSRDRKREKQKKYREEAKAAKLDYYYDHSG